jgi:hypothetical protein
MDPADLHQNLLPICTPTMDQAAVYRILPPGVVFSMDAAIGSESRTHCAGELSEEEGEREGEGGGIARGGEERQHRLR